MKDYIIKAKVHTSDENQWELFKSTIEKIAKEMQVDITLEGECDCTSEVDQSLCIREFTCEDCTNYSNGYCDYWGEMLSSIDASDCAHILSCNYVADLSCKDDSSVKSTMRITPMDYYTTWDELPLEQIVRDTATIHNSFAEFLKEHPYNSDNWILTDIN